MSLRPILKQSSSDRNSNPQRVVRFPPSAALTSTHYAYSAATYDRSSIAVDKNPCALPSRGGRTYHDSGTPYPAPRPQRPRDDRRSLPQLIPDVSSSESDESDLNNSPTISYIRPSYPQYDAHGLPTKYDCQSPTYHQYPTGPAALSFLPYAPAQPALEDKRRRPTAPDYDRRRSSNSSTSSTSSCESQPRSSSKKRSTSSRRQEYLNKLASAQGTAGLCSGFAGVSLQDDGCLGGF